MNLPALHAAVDAPEMETLRARWGDFPAETVALRVAPPFLTGENQTLTNRRRRAEICYVLHAGDPAQGVLLHIKTYYPADCFRLPTGGIQQGEGVEATLAREIFEETGLRVGHAGPRGVQVERFLGVLVYAMEHSTLGPQPFATYHFLVRAQPAAPLEPQDADERIGGWRWVPASGLAQVAATLAAVGTRPAPLGPRWGQWGAFRALSHRFVAKALAKG